jgi:hypothetical protein
MTAMEAAKAKNYDELCIINCSFSIRETLKSSLENEGVDCVCPPDNLFSEFFYTASMAVWWVVSALYNSFKAYLRGRYASLKLGKRTIARLSKQKRYYVIKTFIYNQSFSPESAYKDSFFGKLPEFISAKKDVVIFGCVLGDFIKCINGIKYCSSNAIVPVEIFLSFSDVLSALLKLLSWKVKVREPLDFFGYNVSGIIRNEIKSRFKDIQIYHYLHYSFTRNLLKHIKVECFLMTYENNPWEKMCISALREYSPYTRIIGYQHAIISQASANMFLSCREKGIMPSPDKILTVGNATKNILFRYGCFEETMIAVSCGLRFDYLFNSSILLRRKTSHILVALEGVKDVHKLVGYVLRQIGGNSKFEVRVRTHPVLGWKYFQRVKGYDLAKYPNVRLSPNETLKSDLEWSDVVIYWGSTLGVEALNMGRPVIHYDTGSVLSYDPLFENTQLKSVVTEHIDLSQVLDKILGLSDLEFNDQLGKAKAYLKDYFIPVTQDNMEIFIKSSEHGEKGGIKELIRTNITG